ncbi:MAG: hypothetical protein HQL64_03555 [Magnetococcales bacterium]|nr:hypothetical protein [Magnetococcales bacterium]
MKRRSITVTEENFHTLHGLVRDLIETYRLYAENWVVDQFRELPETPSATAIVALQSWVDHCLSVQFADQLITLMERRESAPGNASLFLPFSVAKE